MGARVGAPALEGAAYRAEYASGLLEVFVGAGLVLMGLAWLAGQVVLAAVVPGLLLALWPGAKSRLIEPRAGRVVFRAARRRRERRSLAILLLVGVGALGIAVLLLVLGGSGWAEADRLVRGLPAAILCVATGLSAGLFGLPRLYLPSALLFLGAAAAVALELDPGWSLLGPGVVLMGAGGVLLATFLRRQPPVRPE